MEVRMSLRSTDSDGVPYEDVDMETYFIFVARDATTGKAANIKVRPEFGSLDTRISKFWWVDLREFQRIPQFYWPKPYRIRNVEALNQYPGIEFAKFSDIHSMRLSQQKN